MLVKQPYVNTDLRYLASGMGANVAQLWSYQSQTTMTTTVPVTVLLALENTKQGYITDFTATNADTADGTWVTLLAGTTIVCSHYAGSNGGGFTINLKSALEYNSLEDLKVVCEAAAEIRVTVSGFYTQS